MADIESKAQMSREENGRTSSLRNVLFVDDEQHLLDAVERALRKKFDVHTALSGQLGLEAIRKSDTFPVIVADLRMPQMGGIEFLKRALEASPRSVTMVLTGNADRESAAAAVEQGHVLHFLSKPCPMDVLAKAVDAGIRLFDLELQIADMRDFLHSVA